MEGEGWSHISLWFPGEKKGTNPNSSPKLRELSTLKQREENPQFTQQNLQLTHQVNDFQLTQNDQWISTKFVEEVLTKRKEND